MAAHSSTYYSNGKLLLTGEYVVLDGALSLALPSTYGQYLAITKIKHQKILWKSLDENGNIWFKTTINCPVFNALSSYADGNTAVETTSDKKISNTLLNILSAARKLNPGFLNMNHGYEITTKLTFPINWGLGSSSTLINNIAQWAKVDAYKLLWNSFPGSGYDIACAQHRKPVIYQLHNKKPIVKYPVFHPPFATQLYFIYLNRKQNSNEGIHRYQAVKEDKTGVIKAISDITGKIAVTNSIEEFEDLIAIHETLIAGLIKLPKIKDQLFTDYFGKIKSLGAWGGDFILATGNEDTPSYFKRKGFTTVIPYRQMVLGEAFCTS